MGNLSSEARLIGEIVGRVLRRYQEKLHQEDYQRRALESAIGELPDIIQESVQAIRLERARARPHPGARALRPKG